MHDEHYKHLFAFPRMVEDLLRGFVRGDWIDAVDFSTLDKLSAEYVSDERRSRHGDTVWRVRHRDAWLHVLVLLEFQSNDDPDMALRILEYTTLLYQELARNRALESDGRRPPVLPVVLYNGDAPWRAARDVGDLITPVSPSLAPYQPAQRYVVLDERHVRSDDALEHNLMAAVVELEQSRSPQDLQRVVTALPATRLGAGRAQAGARVRRMGVAAGATARAGRHAPARLHSGGREDDAGRTRERVAPAMATGRARTGTRTGDSNRGSNRGSNKDSNRDSNRDSNSNAPCCAAWPRRGSVLAPPNAWSAYWNPSPTRNASPRSVN